MDKIIEKVQDFANRVKGYAMLVTAAATANRTATALQGIQRVLTETGKSDIQIGTVTVAGTDLDLAISALQAEADTSGEERQDLTKLANEVNVFIENELLDEDTLPVATDAMTLWGEVNKSGKARSLRVAS